MTKKNEKNEILERLYKNLGLNKEGEVESLAKLKSTQSAQQILEYYEELRKPNTKVWGEQGRKDSELFDIIYKNKDKTDLLEVDPSESCRSRKECLRLKTLFAAKNFVPILGPAVAFFQSKGFIGADKKGMSEEREKIKYQKKYEDLIRKKKSYQDIKNIKNKQPQGRRRLKSGITFMVGALSTALGVKAVIDSQKDQTTSLTESKEKLDHIKRIGKRVLQLEKLQSSSEE